MTEPLRKPAVEHTTARAIGGLQPGLAGGVRRFLEPAQDLLVLGIGLALFGVMTRTLVRLLGELIAPVPCPRNTRCGLPTK